MVTEHLVLKSLQNSNERREGCVKSPLLFFMEVKEIKIFDSPYYCTIDGISYYFSANSRLNRFLARYKENRILLSNKLSIRYKCYIQLNLLADIDLYMRVETKGFYIVDNMGREYKWPSQIMLNGVKMMKLN